jgi:hypothetical protein
MAKGYLKAKEKNLWKLKYFTMESTILKQNPLKEILKNPSRYYNTITNL